MQNSRYIRKFERFLFNGVPEQPEPTFEREYNANVSMRDTGKSQAFSSLEELPSEFVVVGKFVYDFDKGVDEYTPLIDENHSSR